MLDVATPIAALAVIVLLIASALSILAMILRGAVMVCNRITSDAKPIPIPSLGRSVAITLLSIFVNGVLLIGFTAIASLAPGTGMTLFLVLFAVAAGTFTMAKIVADILPSNFGRAFAIMFAATTCQTMIVSIGSSTIWTYINS